LSEAKFIYNKEIILNHHQSKQLF